MISIYNSWLLLKHRAFAEIVYTNNELGQWNYWLMPWDRRDQSKGVDRSLRNLAIRGHISIDIGAHSATTDEYREIDERYGRPQGLKISYANRLQD